MDTLLGLSVQQPWLDMILRGVKSLEIRTWDVRTRGLVALHAPWKIDFAAAYFYGYDKPWRLPRGKVVALAEIAEVLELNEETWVSALEQHRQPLPFLGGAYAVRFANVRSLQRPVSCRGRQMLFPLPQDVVVRVLAGARL